MPEQIAEIEAIAEACRENPGIDVRVALDVDAAKRRVVARSSSSAASPSTRSTGREPQALDRLPRGNGLEPDIRHEHKGRARIGRGPALQRVRASGIPRRYPIAACDALADAAAAVARADRRPRRDGLHRGRRHAERSRHAGGHIVPGGRAALSRRFVPLELRAPAGQGRARLGSGGGSLAAAHERAGATCRSRSDDCALRRSSPRQSDGAAPFTPSCSASSTASNGWRHSWSSLPCAPACKCRAAAWPSRSHWRGRTPPSISG